MAAATDFNVGAGVKAERKLLMTYVDVSGSTTPEWEIVGAGVEDSSYELNPNVEKKKDILGLIDVSVSFEPTQSFEPFTVRGGNKLAFKLYNIIRNNTPELLSQFKVLTVYACVDGSNSTTQTPTFEADVQNNCTIEVTSFGGSEYIDMPINIHYSNNKVLGTVSMSNGVPTFTADSASSNLGDDN